MIVTYNYKRSTGGTSRPDAIADGCGEPSSQADRDSLSMRFAGLRSGQWGVDTASGTCNVDRLNAASGCSEVMAGTLVATPRCSTRIFVRCWSRVDRPLPGVRAGHGARATDLDS